uniref:FHA domain-containing protein n=1 Tax=Paramoeba aestuarina TaxID=180227 RepID=A0A7S4L904_9EUKA
MTSAESVPLYFTLEQAEMEQRIAKLFKRPDSSPSHKEAEVENPETLSGYVNTLMELHGEKGMNTEEVIRRLLTTEEHERALMQLFILLKKEAPNGVTKDTMKNFASRILKTYKDEVPAPRNSRSIATQCCREQRRSDGETYTMNQTWPQVRPYDLHMPNVTATSALLFKKPVDCPTGGGKRPRVDPHTLLQPISRLCIGDKVVFVQYTTSFFFGCDSVKTQADSFPLTANGLNISNNYFDVSPYSQAVSKRACKFHGCIFYDTERNSFHLLSYGSSGIQIFKGTNSELVFDDSAELENGDVIEMLGVKISFQIVDL